MTLIIAERTARWRRGRPRPCTRNQVTRRVPPSFFSRTLRKEGGDFLSLACSSAKPTFTYTELPLTPLRIYTQTPEVHRVHFPTVVRGFRTLLAAGAAGPRPLPDRLAAAAALPHRRHRPGRRIHIPARPLPPASQAASHARKAVIIKTVQGCCF